MQEGDPARVLLVDDDLAFLQRMTRRVEALQSEVDVLTETEPDAALDRLAGEHAVGCVVGSTALPTRSGVELLNAVQERDSELPVVALATDATTPNEALEAGATNALRKSAVREEPSRLTSTVEAVVGRRRSRERLRTEFGVLDELLGSLDDIVYVTDTDGQPIYWNEAATRATGYSLAEVRRLDLLDLFPEDEHDTVLGAVEAVFEQDAATFEADLSTKAGERVRYEFSSTALRDESGTSIGICGTGRDVSHRHYYQSALRALLRTTRELFAAATREEIATTAAAATEYIVDCPLSSVFLREGDRLVSVEATDNARELLGELPTYDVSERTPAAEAYRTGESVLVDRAADIDDDHRRTAGWGVLYVPLGEHGVLALGFREEEPVTSTHRQLAEQLAANTTAALTRHAGECALARRERMLETLHDATRELVLTSDRTEIARLVVTDADEILDLTATAVYLWDDDDGVLRPAAKSDDVEVLFGELEAVGGRDGHIWEAFVDAETTVVGGGTETTVVGGGTETTEVGGGTEATVVDWDRSSEGADAGDSAGDDAAVHDTHTAEPGPPSQLFVPIGEHGVLVSGSTDPDAFDESAVGFAELLATNTVTALDRAEREQALREKDRQLERQNEELRRLNRLGAIVRRINAELIQADSRTEILDVVCETLSDVENYRFTWIGEETTDGEGSPTALAFAGEGRSILEHARTPASSGESAPVAERRREQEGPVVVNDIHRATRADSWRKAALNHGFRSLICLPLRFEGQEYGFLEIYADRPGLFTDEEVAVLSELAAHIANAIDAVERKEALLSGRETQLAFEFDDVDDPLVRLAQRTEATITVDGLVPHGTGAWVVYATADDTDATALTAAVEQSSAITDVDVLRTGDAATLVSLTAADLTVVNALASQNATVRGLHVGPEGGQVSVTVTPSTDVRGFVETCQEWLPGLALVRRQAVTSGEPGRRLKYDLTDLLTGKQLEALQTAYFLGYFEWPRAATGVDVAEALSVSPPTFQQHLRKSLQCIFERTFEVRE